ncbi:MAG TPA: AbrB/MazE/SpoVT family DNA-binding domain-containing protein [Candidatus Bathyarchaeia archaeon]|nr:AbrB/MazE/SpoVT family DNA-binding domain-containing protein [Candidatus Bathyarchaeia archaeon]
MKLEYHVAIFKTKLIKWGNSVGITIPKPVRDTLGFKIGDDVELIDKENHVILRKSKERK